MYRSFTSAVLIAVDHSYSWPRRFCSLVSCYCSYLE